MKKYLPSIASLFSICAVVAVLLAVTNYITTPFIKKNEEQATKKALSEVLPGEASFSPLELTEDLPESITEAYAAESGGYVFKMNVTGYSTDMIILCGIRADGSISKAICLSSTETLGYEKTYGDSLAGKNSSNIDEADTVSGATKTTEAYKKAVKDALSAFDSYTADK